MSKNNGLMSKNNGLISKNNGVKYVDSENYY